MSDHDEQVKAARDWETAVDRAVEELEQAGVDGPTLIKIGEVLNVATIPTTVLCRSGLWRLVTAVLIEDDEFEELAAYAVNYEKLEKSF